MKYASFSKNAPEKPRNGDYCRIIEHETGTIVAIIIDGSGSDPCDWKAAETAGKVMETTIETAATVDKAIMIAAVENAGKAVAEIFGLCSGARASLGMAVLEKNGVYRLLNLGHSKIFHYNGSDLSAQITGQNNNLLGDKLPELVVVEGRLNKKEGIVLLSRGVVEHTGRAFLPDFRYLFSKANPENNLPLLMERYLQGQQEDLTVVFVVNE